MKFTTFSILAGSEACNARCPFCISGMTPLNGLTQKEPDVNWRNFRLGARMAKASGVQTAMITGKGEPTLFPGQISRFLEELLPYEFPLVELQTNGIPLIDKRERYTPYLEDWYEKDLSTIAISIVHYDPEKNKEIYLPYRDEYIDLPALTSLLHDNGFSVRLSCIMADGYIDSALEVERLAQFATENCVEQLTLRPVNRPGESRNLSIGNWIDRHHLQTPQLEEISAYLADNGHPVLALPHGGTVYDLHGQNVCITNSLTLDTQMEESRQLIFFPDGHLRYDWQYPGAILL